MKTEKDKEIDDLFKRGLEPSDARQGHMEEDWNTMQQMLDERKKRPVIVYWLPILGSVAAVLLLVIGWWLLKPVVIPQHQKPQIAANKIDTVTPGAVRPKATRGAKTAQEQQITENTDTVTPPNEVDKQNLHRHNHGIIADNLSKGKGNRSYISNNVNKDNDSTGQFGVANRVQNSNNRRYSGNLVAYNPTMVIGGSNIKEQTIKPVDYLGTSTSNRSLYISRKNAGISSRPQFAITVLAASDKNGVGSFQQTKPGNNVGLLFSVGLGKRFTISTGAVYDAKQYISSFANYHTAYQFPTNPISVSANCKMFDIPLNIDYRVFNSYRNKISVGTGVSSYLMLHESYQYNYGEYGISGPTRYNVPNPDKYLFSTLNLQATYERQINSNVGITLQPYMKLPLSAVGASQVRLQSTGVAVGLTWNLNSSSKP